MIVTNAGRDAVDADAPITNGADADGKTVWSWHPLLVSSRRRFFEPNRAYEVP